MLHLTSAEAEVIVSRCCCEYAVATSIMLTCLQVPVQKPAGSPKVATYCQTVAPVICYWY